MKIQKKKICLSTVCFGIGCIFALNSFAGTGGTELQAAEDRITDLITGTGGKLAAIVSLGMALVGSIFKFNITQVASAIGVGILASMGVGAVTTGITALI